VSRALALCALFACPNTPPAFVVNETKQTPDAPDAADAAPKQKFDVLGILYDGPEIVEHAPFADAPFDVTPFVKAGCKQDMRPRAPALDCSALAARFGCNMAGPAYGPLLYFSRKKPMATCHAPTEDAGPDALIGGCMIPQSLTYLVEIGKDFRRVWPSELAGIFGPVDSPEEALAFAIATTLFMPMYVTRESLADARFYAPRIEATFVADEGSAYRVHLFGYSACGCGPHAYSAVDVIVAKNGSVTSGPAQTAFAYARDDHVCID